MDMPKMTPAELKQALAMMNSHPALRDATHPQHQAVVAERQRLMAMAEPPTPA